MDLAAAVAAFLAAQVAEGTLGVVAVSGGPDSVAVAHVLARLGTPPRLVLAHVNHQLRGTDSDGDEHLVTDLPARWGRAELRCRTVRFDTRAAAHGHNLEAVARDQRYAWLTQVALAEGAAWIATGHTADDQAETVLFRLLRGSGLDGLRGIAPVRALHDGLTLIRPLLTVRRADVRAYLAEQGLPFREDTSNLDLTFTRNRLRHALIPQLEHEYNPQLVPVLSRLAEQARTAQAEAHRQAADLLDRAQQPRVATTVVLRLDVLAAAPAPCLRDALRLVWEREDWPRSAMGFDHWQRLVELVHGDRTAWDLPGGVHARRAGHVLQLTRDP